MERRAVSNKALRAIANDLVVRAALTYSHNLLALLSIHCTFVVFHHCRDLAMSVMAHIIEFQLLG